MRRELFAILVLILAVLFLMSVIEFYKSNIEQSDARKFVMEELKSKYPSGDIEIISVQDANANGSKYFKINAKVTLNSAGPCPERMHIFFNYPEQNFVSQPPEYVTKDCKTCVSKESCPILFPEEAIIASHTFEGTEEVQKYVNEEKGIFSLASEKEKSWLVTWDSPFSSYYYEVEISKNASVLGIKKIPKED